MKHRITQTILLVFVIAIIAFVLINWSTTLFYVIGVGFQLLSVIISFRLLFIDKRGTNSNVTLILIIFIITIMCIILYSLFGRNPQTRKSTEVQINESKKIINATRISPKTNSEFISELALKQTNLTKLPPLNKSDVEILTNGDATFKEILTHLKQAKNHIHIQYYIFKDDKISTEIRDVLIDKANSGVEVRFMYDGFGSHALSEDFLAPLKLSGAEVYPYDPIYSPWIVRTANLRNHRKIIVIDGQIGFTGGLNVGEEYRSNTDEFKFWRDTHMLIKGKAVKELQQAFLKDWVYLQNKVNSADQFITPLGIDKYFTPHPIGRDWVQIVYGGPYDEENYVRDSMLNLMEKAQKSVWIVSPYFVPDDESLAVIRRVALNGLMLKLLYLEKEIVEYRLMEVMHM